MGFDEEKNYVFYEMANYVAVKYFIREVTDEGEVEVCKIYTSKIMLIFLPIVFQWKKIESTLGLLRLTD